MKALALFSGGLDSMLAIKLITMQNIGVTALYMDIGFGGKDDKSEIMSERARMAGAEFLRVDIRDEYLQNVLFSPKYGYGKQFNPCIDCHGYMFKTALSMLGAMGASFVISGEVLGQRPMSQRAAAMAQVRKLSSDENNLILRPLSAKLMAPSAPEINGWVDREKLLDISGRGRTRQMELAGEFGFDDYETPAGGCLLTIQSYADKIKDMMKFEKLQTSQDAEILKFGRHLRLSGGAKMIIGRNEDDNARLRNIQNPKFVRIKFIEPLVGAYSLISRGASRDDMELAAKFALTYMKFQPSKSYEVIIENEKFMATPFEDKAEAQKYFIN
ncbi:argininosuccinate synthase [Campylobacter sp. JMF_06 NA1]|uniref:argininosuccinate synthase domain-containing protein n=1 Tax=Campylobacter sp. JMF_06 NA1 TaxID=2983823 RepID=UPI0022E9B24E|nr:argininosuccinate synthase domain-containing protein [Campylobacter sp. JMF_06 NA1]MDA3078259.1 argininosuccinate synthase [Campylobacter sp. JMF_06 NA1]